MNVLLQQKLMNSSLKSNFFAFMLNYFMMMAGPLISTSWFVLIGTDGMFNPILGLTVLLIYLALIGMLYRSRYWLLLSYQNQY